MMRPRAVFASTLLILAFAALPLQAGNGHFLHGVGAVNSSLGGAGTGLAFESVGAMHANPALLTRLDGTQVTISVEAFKDDLSVTTLGPGFPNHTTESDGELGLLPAIAWSYNPAGSDWAFGFGVLAVAGFRTAFPEDQNSFLLAAQPVGFGRLQTDLAVTKIPIGLAWDVNPNLTLGAALTVFQGSLIIQPLPVVTPDCFPVNDFTGTCFRPGTSGQVSSYGFGAQLGLYWQINPAWSLGLSYTTEQDFDEYQWNSNIENPLYPTLATALPGQPYFGQHRRIGIDIDGPPIASVGIGWQPNPDLKVALDARWVGYKDTEGIGGAGGISSDLRLVSIGWDDILIGMLGVEWRVNPALRLRGGLNVNESPIDPFRTLNSGGTPSVFEEHYTAGLSWAVTSNVDLDLGGYYTPENEISGPFYGPNDAIIPNSQITIRNSILSGLAGFSFHF